MCEAARVLLLMRSTEIKKKYKACSAKKKSVSRKSVKKL